MTQQQQHLYEGMYIVNAALNDEGRQKAFEKIKTGITSRGGEVRKIFEQGRRRLAYEIQGRREGYYYLLYFSLPTSEVAPMWRDCRLHDQLLRFTTLRVDVVPEKIEFKPIVQQ